MEVNQVILPVSEQEKDFEVHLSEVCLPLNLMSAHFAACSPACSVTPGGLCSSAMGCCADVTCTYWLSYRAARLSSVQGLFCHVSGASLQWWSCGRHYFFSVNPPSPHPPFLHLSLLWCFFTISFMPAASAYLSWHVHWHTFTLFSAHQLCSVLFPAINTLCPFPAINTLCPPVVPVSSH